MVESSGKTRGWIPLRAGASGVGRALLAVLCLDAFLVAVRLLGAFRDLGEGLGGRLLQEMVGQPALGLFLGIFLTSVVQSSSSTTSLVVGLAATGALGDDPLKVLSFAVPVVMGANIGSAVTSTLVSLAHLGRPKEFGRAFGCALMHDLFNIYTVALLFPIQVLTNFLGRGAWACARTFQAVGGLRFVSPLKLVVHPQAEFVYAFFARDWACHFVLDFIFVLMFLAGVLRLLKLAAQVRPVWPTALAIAVGVASVLLAARHAPQHLYCGPTATVAAGLTLLLTSLVILVRLMRALVQSKLERLVHAYIFRSTVRALLFGTIVTSIIQSSAVTISLVVPLVGAGILTLDRVYPYALGANIGTTVTAWLAALSLGEPIGIAVAAAHLGFNVLGISVFLPLRRAPLGSARWLAALFGKSRIVPIALLLGVYYLVPLALVFGLRK